MRKFFLSLVGFSLICRFHAVAQIGQDTTHNRPAINKDQTLGQPNNDYSPRALRLDEVDLVSSYYWQNGDHSAVTGGIGTEKVTDISNGIDLKFVWGDPAYRKNTLTTGLGFDHHTSASQAFVNKSGASNTGGSRVYPSLDWTTENAKTGNSFGLGAYYSAEYNYQSLGGDVHFSFKTPDKNGEFSAKFQGYFDHVKLIYPSELIPGATTSGGTVITSASGTIISGDGEHHHANIPSSPRTTLNASFEYSQIINSRLQVAVLADVVNQNGYLGLPFHRVYFNTGKDTVEKLPSNRFKLPIGLRVNYFLGDNIIIRSYYRFYTDSWGIRSNTAGLEIPVKITPFFSISPFYRYYDQTAARYFAPYEAHKPDDEYYTSNYAYSKFNSNFYGIGFRVAPPKGVMGWQSLHELELRYGHYTQTTGLVSNVISLSLGFK
jgi:hypothetical protein